MFAEVKQFVVLVALGLAALAGCASVSPDSQQAIAQGFVDDPDQPLKPNEPSSDEATGRIESDIRSAGQWSEYANNVEPGTAIRCLLHQASSSMAVRIDSGLDRYAGITLESSPPTVRPHVDVHEWLTLLEPLAQAAALVDEPGNRQELQAEIKTMLENEHADHEQVEIRPVLWLMANGQSTDADCPFAWDSPIAETMTNYASSEPRFGGVGSEAARRCLIDAALTASLSLTSGPLGGRLTDSLLAHRLLLDQDRPINSIMLALADRWRQSSKDAAATNRFADDLDAHTGTLPDGIPCPLLV